MDGSKSRDACKRSKSCNRDAGMPITAGTLLKSEMRAAVGTRGTSWMSSAVGPLEQTVGKSTTANSAGTPATIAGTHNYNIKQDQQRQ